jgi:hypothetical protein
LIGNNPKRRFSDAIIPMKTIGCVIKTSFQVHSQRKLCKEHDIYELCQARKSRSALRIAFFGRATRPRRRSWARFFFVQEY